MGPTPKTPLQSLLAHLPPRPADPQACWLWHGADNGDGYGASYRTEDGRRRTWLTHRLSYTIFKGPIPEGLCVLHDCPGGDNRRCCNPNHLWLGTRSDNNKDSMEKGTARGGSNQLARTHCPYGHPYDEKNTRIYQGKRVCKLCAQRITRDWKRKKRLSLLESLSHDIFSDL